ncbi:MAG: 50S ribosomal protein L18 [Candidatus Omnitrophota bacterium]
MDKRVLARRARHKRIRKKVVGTPQRPRLSVYRSNKNIYTQVIDDIAGQTIISLSTRNNPVKDACGAHRGNIKAAKLLGSVLAEKAAEKGLSSLVFDRGGYIYHGRVKALAEAARAGGMKF